MPKAILGGRSTHHFGDLDNSGSVIKAVSFENSNRRFVARVFPQAAQETIGEPDKGMKEVNDAKDRPAQD